MNIDPRPPPAPRRRLLRPGALALLASLVAAACNSAPTIEVTGSAALMKQIEAEVGDAACDGPQQCHSIAVGSKACGGPETYLAWSTQRSGDGSRLKALVDAHAAARARENRQGGMASNCAMVTDPGATCQAHQCRMQARFGASPGRAD